MGLIAMVTGHVPHHLPSPPPPLPSHSHHSSKGDDTGFFSAVCELALLDVEYLPPTTTSRGDVTPSN